MKKVLRIFLVISTLLLLTSCSKKEDLRPVSIGNISFQYDANVWDNTENPDPAAPLEFKDAKGNLISIFVSQESTYQHPLDMIRFYETMISTYEDYKVFLEPTEIKVNDTTWYEYGFSYKDGSTTRKVYQRYYGKFYNAASVSYTSTEKDYKAGYKNALKVMSGFITTDVPNDVNEAKAHKFLVGEWDVANSGYLVLNEDGTYEWYKDSSKDKANMHYGTYGCDIENASMSLKEGDGFYLVLFPDSLVINGEAEKSSSSKIDYLISLNKNETEGYQMVNISTYNLYTITKK